MSAAAATAARPAPGHDRRTSSRSPAARTRSLEPSAETSSLELDDERRELLAPRLRPVVVPVLGQELAGIQRERGTVGRRRLDQACIRSRKLEPIDVDHRHEGEHLVSRPRSPPGRAPVARRALPGGDCSQPPPDRGRARARPSPARGGAGGPARARAASQARAPSSTARPPPARHAVDRRLESAEKPEADIAHLRQPIPPSGRRRHPTDGGDGRARVRPSALRSAKPLQRRAS